MKKISVLIVVLIFTISCSTKNNYLVGNDKDAKGCINSAGYQWSQIKKQCVRPFEEGIELSPVNKSSYAAYLIIQNESTIELFSVENTGSLILNKEKNNLWKKGIWEVEKINGKYILKRNGTELYKN